MIDDDLLRYKFLNEFDAAMQHLESKYMWLSAPQAYISLKNENDKVLVFERAGLLWILNFHPFVSPTLPVIASMGLTRKQKSFTDYRVGVEHSGKYKVVLNTDRKEFGGHERIDETVRYFTTPFEWNNRKNFTQVYLPSRVALVCEIIIHPQQIKY